MYLNISCISLVCNRIYWYVPCMYSYVIRMSLVYVLVCYPYVTRISLVFTRMSSVCHSYVLVCHLYVTCLLFNHKPCITTKTIDSNRAIYFLSLIFYLINKLKSQLLFKVKKIFSPILRRKKLINRLKISLIQLIQSSSEESLKEKHQIFIGMCSLFT